MDFKDVPQYKGIAGMLASAKLANGPDKLHKVIKELDVEHSPRYRAGNGRTWCNVFVTDVLDAHGVLPSHWMAADGGPASKDPAVVNIELNANQLLRWLAIHGSEYGWEFAGKAVAQDAAARGHLVIVGWDSKSAKAGHVAILLPEGTIAQAGATNFVGRTIPEGFGRLPDLQFWVQIHEGEHAK
jgi:hypothetical protein